MAAIAGSPTTTPQDAAVIQAPSIKPAENLWERALEALEKEERANIDLNNTDKLHILQDILTATEEKQRMCLAKRWTYRKGNKEIIIRDQLEKIVRWVDKFKQIGDQVVQYDPSHAALPWAGVRFFLQLAVNDSQMFGAIAEGMEYVSKLITRYVIFEKLYQRIPGESAAELEPKERLSEALCKLYASILRYLSKAKRYYTRNTAERFLKAAKPGEASIDRYLSNIFEAKIDVDECAQLIDTTQRQMIIKNTQELKGYLIQLDDPINRSATLLSDIQDSLKETERRDMFKWLSRTQHANHHKAMGKDFLPDSGNWLLQRKEFVEWRTESSSSILWLHGIPGSGKSKLIHLVIEHLNKARSEKKNPAPMAYFYCVRNPAEPERADPDEIMRSILKQLSSSTSTISVREPVATRYKELKEEATESGCEEPPKLTVAECEELILELLISNPATIVIDALDECNPARRHELLHALDNIIQASSNVVNIFVSSRNDNDIACRLGTSPNVIIKSSDNREDIQRYIISQVDRLVKTKRLLSGKVSEELKKQIISVLTQGAQGMFRWVSLQLQTICDPQRMKHEGDIVAELGKLPKTLNESYKVIFEEIRNSGPTSQRIADGAMKWLLCSMRRLDASEFIAAVSNVDGEYIFLDQRELLDICCNLLVLDEELKTFRFAHLSVREYLETCESFNKVETNALVVQRCLDIYIFEQQDQSELAYEQNKALKPYATLHWPSHCQNLGSDPDDKTKTKVKQFLIQNPDVAPSFVKWTLDVEKSNYIWEVNRLNQIISFPPSPLIFACCFGLDWILHDLAHLKNIQWNQENDDGYSGLSLAAEQGHETIVRFLLQRNEVDVNLQNRDGETILFLAVQSRHEMVVQMLLQRNDVDVNLQNKDGETVLFLAVQSGHEMVVQMLLQRNDADVNLQNRAGQTALFLAVELGHERMVQMLFQRNDVDVNLQNRDGETALFLAARLGHERVVQMLFQRNDVDVNLQHKAGETALHLAAELGHEMVVQMLLECNDVDINLPNNLHQTALSLAAQFGHKRVVQMLLERNDIDADSKNENGRTPLLWAAVKGHETIVRLLLECNDVDADSKDKNGRTPLLRAAEWGHEATVRLLLERNDVDADFKDEDGRTPLSRAAAKGHDAIVRLLFDRDDVDADLKNLNGRTPLSWAAGMGHEPVVRLLLERNDVDADSKDEFGRTPLWWAAGMGHESVVQLLLERNDVDADSKDKNGRTSLSWAASTGEVSVVRLLLDRDDVDADSKDEDDRTPLSRAAYEGRVTVVQLLLERNDVDADSVDRFGKTPRDRAERNGYRKVVQLFDLKKQKCT